MERHVLSVLVENQAGVLSRVAGLFSRRGYNIDSLTVGVTEKPEISRMTIVAKGDKYIISQIKKQLEKLVDVLEIIELKPDASVTRELVLLKIRVQEDTRASIAAITDIFRGKIIDVAPESMTIEITGAEAKLASFIDLMRPYGIKEIVRTGISALQRGNIDITEHHKIEEDV